MIELHERALQAKQQVHPVLKSGHSNAVEASHNVLIRFRFKAIVLQMTHYHVSTNLGLFLSCTHQRCGASYHCIPELYHHMDLPVLIGVQEALERDNEARKKDLVRAKTSPGKRRRIALRKQRVIDSRKCMEWSSGLRSTVITHNYGETEEHVEKKIKPRASSAKKIRTSRVSNLKKCPVKRKHGTYS